jgi:DNA-binding transcriptional regulator YiaG
MANIGVLLKQEIRRLARKEIKLTHPGLKKDLTVLRRSLSRLSKQVKSFEKVTTEFRQKKLEDLKVPTGEVKGARFNARLIAKLRSRLRLTRNEFSTLAGVSSNTVYLWESGKILPSRKAKAVLAGLRKLRVRESKKLLETVIAQKTEKKAPRKYKQTRKKRARGAKK